MPLPVQGVAARGAVAVDLAQALLDLGVRKLGLIKVVLGEGHVVALGPSTLLPVPAGAVALGKDPRAGDLLVPFDLEPALPLDGVQRTMRATYPQLAPPIVLLLAPNQAIAVGGAIEANRPALQRWITAGGG